MNSPFPITSRTPSSQKPPSRLNRWRSWSTRQRLFSMLLAGFVIVVAIVMVAFAFGRSSFDPKRVQVAIDVPSPVVSGSETTFNVAVHNNNRVALRDADLVFHFPEGALMIDSQGQERQADPVRLQIARIPAGETAQQSFSARLIGDIQTDQLAEATLQYRPESLNARFEAQTTQVVRIDRSPVSLVVEAPRQAISGEHITYRISYMLEEDLIGSPVIVAAYPDGFRVERSDPSARNEEKTQWDIQERDAGMEGVIEIEGRIDGLTGQVKKVRVFSGEMRDGDIVAFARTEEETVIGSHPLSVLVDVRGATAGAVDIAGTLTYDIHVRNDAQVALRELIVRARVDGDVVDRRAIRPDNGGFVESGTNTIIWTAATVPELGLLASGESTMVSVRIPLRRSFPIVSSRDTQFVVAFVAEAETESVPSSLTLDRLLRTEKVETKLNTQLKIQSLGMYHEESVAITNTGSHPPQVAERTEYTIHWRIINIANELNSVVVRSTLGPNVSWTGNVVKTIGETTIRFNERTREVVWEVGAVPATTGVALPAYEVVFQVALTPSAQQEGTTPTLVRSLTANGVDQFTGTFLEAQDDAITTALPDDSRAGNNGRVQ